MYIGLDLGTSGLKGLLIDEEQRILAEANAPLDVSRPAPGWSEQLADEWITAAQSVLAGLSAQRSLNAVRGIGLSGQMHGATLLGADDRPLRPCILWNDTRAHEEAAAMDANPVWRAISGNIVFPGFTAPKLAWVEAHEPKTFSDCRKVLLPKDYLRLWLTGEHVSEMSDAAGTSWLDVGQRTWSAELLAETNLDLSHMPRLIEGNAASGQIRSSLAEQFGLPKDTVVAGGAGDNAASAIGAGVGRAGQAFLSLGTSGVLFAANDGYQPAPQTAVHTFCHALPNTWHQMGVILAATDALNWFARLVGKDAAQLTSEVDPSSGPSRTVFLPYLGGERTPLNDAHVRGAFANLDHATDASAGAQSVMEGVAFAFVDCLNALGATGTQIDHVVALGGGSQSRAWVQILADALEIPVQVPAAGEFGAAFGAARLGMMAAGAEQSIATGPEIREDIHPQTDLRDAYAQGYARYRKMAAAMQSLD